MMPRTMRNATSSTMSVAFGMRKLLSAMNVEVIAFASLFGGSTPAGTGRVRIHTEPGYFL